MPSYSALRIANYFITKSNYSLTPIKVIKLVYIAHGYCLAITGEDLIDQPVEAWRHGVMIRVIYDAFKYYGNDEIEKRAEYLYEEDDISKDHLKLLDRIWKMYGHYTSIALSNVTHKEGSPWDQVWNQNGDTCIGSYKINSEIIKKYYKKLL